MAKKKTVKMETTVIKAGTKQPETRRKKKAKKEVEKFIKRYK